MGSRRAGAGALSGDEIGGQVSRPREYVDKRPQVQVRLPKPLLESLRAEARRRDLSVNRIVERALEMYLDGTDAAERL